MLVAMRFCDLCIIFSVAFALFSAECHGSPVAEPRKELAMPSFSFLVLPFTNRSGDPGQDYVADNLTSDLTADLSRITGSFVISQGSAAALASRSLNISEIKQETGVRFVLRGDVSMHGSQLHVEAAVINTSTGEQLWRAAFEREFVKLRTLEREIVAQVAERLGAEITDATSPTVAPNPQNAAALDSLLRANWILRMPQTAKTMGEARQLLDRVLQADPDAVEAMTGVAAIDLAVALNSRGPGVVIELEQCERLLRRTLAIDPRYARALNIMGALRRATGKPREALAAYKAAVAADPNDASAYAQIGRLEIDFGEAEQAIASIERALQLSPFDPERSLWFIFAGLAHLYVDEIGEARGWLERSVEIKPDYVTTLVFLSVAQELDGQHAEARRTVEAARKINPALSIKRVEQQFAPHEPRARAQWARITDALRRIGLPD